MEHRFSTPEEVPVLYYSFSQTHANYTQSECTTLTMERKHSPSKHQQLLNPPRIVSGKLEYSNLERMNYKTDKQTDLHYNQQTQMQIFKRSLLEQS